MRVVKRTTLKEFWEAHPSHAPAQGPLEAWFAEAKAAAWGSPNEIKAQYRNASILKGGRVVFNIKGNDFRLIVEINYLAGMVFIRWIGTHAAYDAIDANTVSIK